MLAVVFVVVLLDGDVCQMDEGVVQVSDVRGVLHIAESGEAVHVLISFERSKGSDEHVEAQVELLAADEQRVLDVARDDVGLFQRQRGPLALGGPLLDLRQLVDDEDALALGARGGLHDPDRVGTAPELLHEERVVRGQQVSHGHEVCGKDGLRVSRQLLHVALDVLHHEILAGQLEVVGEVVDHSRATAAAATVARG
eukprot:scaffold12089_cov176-Ochromonas_danica.AAC.6